MCSFGRLIWFCFHPEHRTLCGFKGRAGYASAYDRLLDETDGMAAPYSRELA
jgi:hypothetical protein